MAELITSGRKIRTDYYWFKEFCFLPDAGRDIERLKIETFLSCKQEYYARCFVEMEMDLFIMHPMMHANVSEGIEVECSMIGNLISSSRVWSCYQARIHSCIRKGIFLKNVRNFSDVVKKQARKKRRTSRFSFCK